MLWNIVFWTISSSCNPLQKFHIQWENIHFIQIDEHFPVKLDPDCIIPACVTNDCMTFDNKILNQESDRVEKEDKAVLLWKLLYYACFDAPGTWCNIICKIPFCWAVKS